MISVIIPTRNRADLLMSALDSLVYQNISQSEFEIIVVDNGSTDNTSEVIRKKQTKLSNLHSLYEPIAGLHAGRHAGMKAAKGEILVYADDDIEAFPTWLSSIKDAFSNPEIAMVGGNNLPMFLEPPPSWLLKMWQQGNSRGLKTIPALSIIKFPDDTSYISPYQIWGCNFAIRKDVLISVGGFHPDGMPGDLIKFRGDGETHVSRSVSESGMKCLFSAGATVYHKVTPERMTLDYFYRRGFNQGISDSYSVLRNHDPSSVKINTNFFRTAVGNIIRALKGIKTDKNIRKAKKLMKLGQKEGFSFHQQTYRDEVEVREWVHKETYF